MFDGNISSLFSINNQQKLMEIINNLPSLNAEEILNLVELLSKKIESLENQLTEINNLSSLTKTFDSLQDINILFIEDNLVSAKIFAQRLALETEYQFNLTHKISLQQGFEIIKKKGQKYFDLVILDLNLPDSYGLNTLREFKKNFRHIPVIVLTGDYQKQLALESIKIGAQDYLVKQYYLGNKNIPHDVFMLPLLSAIERQEKENRLAHQNLQIYLTNEKLKQSQEVVDQNLATFDVAVDGLAILQHDRYTYMNKAHLTMFGYENLQELPDNNWRSFYFEDEIENFENNIFPSLIKNKVWSGEAIAKRKDGSTFPQELSLTLTDKNYLICVCRDITERKKSEQILKEALLKAEEVNELKSRLITLTSHEFRTPLTVIASSVGILKTFGHKLSDESKQEHFTTIETYIEHTTKLLDDILLINRAESQQLSYHLEPINIANFCYTLVKEIQQTYGEYKIVFQVNNKENLTTKEYDRNLDKKLLTQILTNLISNSVKYSGDNKIIDVVLTIQPKNIILEVIDRGIGIPLETQANLFTTFYRGKNVGNIQGTGLGLSIVKECVNLLKGTISVKSKVNEGTTVSINIPC
ncbi:ATP-binding protein [Geminocystis sp. CENA526]|uniref:ATP-binding protein n=1 Tax=Geminocystis sp. CENA526 TaxID=1355871 RepID=UPI003D6F4130